MHLTSPAQDAGARRQAYFISVPHLPAVRCRQRRSVLASWEETAACRLAALLLGLAPPRRLAFARRKPSRAWRGLRFFGALCLLDTSAGTGGALTGWSGCRNGKLLSKMLIWATRCARTRSTAPCRCVADSKMCMPGLLLVNAGPPWGSRAQKRHPPYCTCR